MIKMWQETIFITFLSYFKKLQYVKYEDQIDFNLLDNIHIKK